MIRESREIWKDNLSNQYIQSSEKFRNKSAGRCRSVIVPRKSLDHKLNELSQLRENLERRRKNQVELMVI